MDDRVISGVQAAGIVNGWKAAGFRRGRLDCEVEASVVLLVHRKVDYLTLYWNACSPCSYLAPQQLQEVEGLVADKDANIKGGSIRVQILLLFLRAHKPVPEDLLDLPIVLLVLTPLLFDQVECGHESIVREKELSAGVDEAGVESHIVADLRLEALLEILAVKLEVVGLGAFLLGNSTQPEPPGV